jgi:hypothetical protein
MNSLEAEIESARESDGTDDTEATAFDQHASQPAGNKTYDEKPQQTHFTLPS